VIPVALLSQAAAALDASAPLWLVLAVAVLQCLLGIGGLGLLGHAAWRDRRR
jgi:hypothetical protein